MKFLWRNCDRLDPVHYVTPLSRDFVIKQREKWLLDICDETEFDRRNKLRTIRLCSYNLGFLLIVWSGFIVT